MKLEQLHEEQEVLLAKRGETTARKMAKQFVTTGIRQFDGKEELRAAKKMARSFFNMLVKHIESEYNHLKMKEVSEEEDMRFSLTERQGDNSNDEGVGA